MSHAMIDLETLGVGDNAPIVQIGAVIFGPEGVHLSTKFEVNIDLEADGPEVIGTPDMSTIKWWLGQDLALRTSVFRGDSQCLSIACCMLNNWLEKHDVRRVWANSPHFDIRLLKQAYVRAGVTPWPMSHRAEMDLRTLVQMARLKDPGRDLKIAPRHTALGDAIDQAHIAIKLMKEFGVW